MAVRFSVLGPLELVVDGQPVALGGGKEQLVLSALLLDVNRVVPVERIIDWVWGDERPERHSTLQVHVSNLRRRLAAASPEGAALLQTRRPGYVIELGADELDSLRFGALRREGEDQAAAGRLEQAAEAWRSALTLWRGQPLAGLALSTGARSEVSRLEGERAVVIEQLAELELRRGRHVQVVDEVRGWLADQPLNERLRGLYMLALYRCGRQADALAAFQEGRKVLLDELGIDPSKPLRDLENQILQQDPALDLAAHRRAEPAAADATVLRGSVLVREAHLVIGDGTVELRPGVTTIGRRPDRDVVLDDPAASRVHAEIRTTPEGCTLVDAGSANGTRVGGRRVDQHLLCDGDVVQIGDSELRFVLGPVRPT